MCCEINVVHIKHVEYKRICVCTSRRVHDVQILTGTIGSCLHARHHNPLLSQVKRASTGGLIDIPCIKCWCKQDKRIISSDLSVIP
jgi:hypothetical protein